MNHRGQEITTDYDKGGSSTSAEKPRPEKPLELSEEVRRYGTGKPRRVIIRARVAHGSD